MRRRFIGLLADQDRKASTDKLHGRDGWDAVRYYRFNTMSRATFPLGPNGF